MEDLISESMAKGDFDNLPGAGKPLPQRVIYNPYEDYTTYKVYKQVKIATIMTAVVLSNCKYLSFLTLARLIKSLLKEDSRLNGLC